MAVDVEEQKKANLRTLGNDLRKANESITKILTGENKTINGRVMDRDYLNPSIMFENLNLDNPAGELAYFTRIRDTLETALKEGYIPADKMPERAPSYLTRLAR